MPAQPRGGFDGVDKRDAAEVHVIVAELGHDVLVVDAFWADVRVRVELRGAEEEGEELVVVEAPDAVGAGRLEVVGCLEVPDEVEVF